MHVMSQKHILAYNKFIFCYVDGVKTLYLDKKIKPIHHAALHIGDILELFSPVHSHSAPFFECYIKFLH